MRTLADIADVVRGTVHGDGAREIEGITPPEGAVRSRLCVVWNARLLSALPPEVPLLTSPGMIGEHDGIELAEPRGALPELLALFDTRRRPSPGIHPSAAIDPEADVSSDAHIGPHCTVARGAKIGASTVLTAGVYIGEDTTVGEGCTLEPGAVVMDQVSIGDRVIIHAGAKIGCDGFGFIPTGRAKWKKIPQIGTVRIEDDAEIGANCSIDRAMFGVTRIGRGTKIGDMTHIAHNCSIGEGCVMSGFSGISGSVTIGDGCVIAGMVGMADHITIGSGTTVAGRSGVTKDIPGCMTVSGYPARDHGEEKRFQASLRRFDSYRARTEELERTVEELKRTIEEMRG